MFVDAKSEERSALWSDRRHHGEFDFDCETPRQLLEPSDSPIMIPVVSVGYRDGQRLRKLPPGDVRVNITAGDTLGSYRWLLGEETIVSPSMRDMWFRIPRARHQPHLYA